ncbi:MAG TPA: hypothetical protein DIT97_00355 [Gimesia maris]|uniref:DUF2997 domain-containing protein n=1 Tax=Gimesia maris TaxID=122 RepID=A0A3D3QYA8_9PLAN|nr:hypothetical protein [Gimesia maris]|tara:strand:- start:6341 stop:6535 length:195 start_codon:yes stop_codon:yes gene_type:complete
MTRIIEITVATDGQTRVETRGFSGAGCREASRFIETALGKRTKEQLTAEFHQQLGQQQTNRQQS